MVTPSQLLAAALQHHRSGDLSQAERLYLEVLRRAPDQPDALHLLGAIAHATGRHALAADYLQQAIGIDARNPDYHVNLGLALKSLGRCEEALVSFDRALALNPDFAEAHHNRGSALQALGRLDEAEAAYRTATRHRPTLAAAWLNLGNLLQLEVRLEEARFCFERALEAAPASAEALNNLGYNFQLQVRLEEAVGCYRRALELHPDFAPARANLLFGLLYLPGLSREALFLEYRSLLSGPLPAPLPAPTPDRNPDRRLRIGYVSPNFKRHSDVHFLEPLLAGHDREQVEVFCYAEVSQPDETTGRMRSLADHWHSTVGLSDARVAGQIRADGIDVLVEVAGHTAQSRISVFELRPAPVQVSYHGLGTTALDCFDYRLTDAFSDPIETRPFHTETLVYLPHFACYAPPRRLAPITPLPALRNGYVTFASFNNLSKVNARVIEAWAAVLQAVEGSRLLLKAAALADGEVRARVQATFAGQGIDPRRLTLLGHTPGLQEHLELYQQVDIGLDPFPYDGSITTWEALWMGVPVLTLPGPHTIGRMTGSQLTALGLEALIADSPAGLVEIAGALAWDLVTLAELRASLRQRVAQSSLCDGTALTAQIEARYREMWRGWCLEGAARSG